MGRAPTNLPIHEQANRADMHSDIARRKRLASEGAVLSKVMENLDKDLIIGWMDPVGVINLLLLPAAAVVDKVTEVIQEIKL